MDLLKDAAKNLNLYEVKAYVRKAQNVAMNLTEMEAKVREATNNEPWGAPTSLMTQIASGTYNYREREEIIGFIFRRFTEKAANEWRQIYKALQLLDYLIKNGSERLIDDVRANLSLIQMLKSFHYIDSKGRDQGINVRNRAKNLIALLNDDPLIRSERKKARNNAKKFGGVSSAAFGGASSITSGIHYDDDFANRVYGDGGVYGERYDDPASAYSNGNSGNSNDNFEEYDASTPASSAKPTTNSSKVTATASTQLNAQSQEPTQDLLGDLVSFDVSSSSQKQPSAPAAEDDGDDEFDDFQAAPSQSQKSSITNNLSNLYQSQQSQRAFFAPPQQNQSPQILFTNNTPNYSINTNRASTTGDPIKPSSNNDAFSSLFTSAKTKSKSSSAAPSQSNTSSVAPNVTSTTSKSFNDDLFGDFSSNNTKSNGNDSGNTNNNSGEIDLLSF